MYIFNKDTKTINFIENDQINEQSYPASKKRVPVSEIKDVLIKVIVLTENIIERDVCQYNLQEDFEFYGTIDLLSIYNLNLNIPYNKNITKEEKRELKFKCINTGGFLYIDRKIINQPKRSLYINTFFLYCTICKYIHNKYIKNYNQLYEKMIGDHLDDFIECVVRHEIGHYRHELADPQDFIRKRKARAKIKLKQVNDFNTSLDFIKYYCSLPSEREADEYGEVINVNKRNELYKIFSFENYTK